MGLTEITANFDYTETLRSVPAGTPFPNAYSIQKTNPERLIRLLQSNGLEVNKKNSRIEVEWPMLRGNGKADVPYLNCSISSSFGEDAQIIGYILRGDNFSIRLENYEPPKVVSESPMKYGGSVDVRRGVIGTIECSRKEGLLLISRIGEVLNEFYSPVRKTELGFSDIEPLPECLLETWES